MDDIEDLIGAGGVELGAGSAVRVPEVKLSTRHPIPSPEDENDPLLAQQLKAAKVPGAYQIWTKTYGCSHNVSDGEYMQGQLDAQGYRFTDERDSADLWLINSCTVKDPSQFAFTKLLKQGQAAGKSVVVTGCVPQADRSLHALDGISMVGVTQIDRVVEVVEETLKGNTVRLLGKKELPRLDLPKIRKNPLVEIIPLSTGCLGSCTYCKTKHARGLLGSYDPDAIVARASQALSDGVQQIWLSSEDTGAYGRDLDINFPTLLKKLLPVLIGERTTDKGARLSYDSKNASVVTVNSSSTDEECCGGGSCGAPSSNVDTADNDACCGGGACGDFSNNATATEGNECCGGGACGDSNADETKTITPAAEGQKKAQSQSRQQQNVRKEVPRRATDEHAMMRVGMTNPPFILDSLDEIATALNHPHVFSFLHIPVQSGSDAVLEGMHREYTVAEFRMVADYLIKHVPGITIATDIICGFPGETDADFEETMELCKQYQFPVLNISQFYPRPGTPAAKMKQINRQIVKQRSRALTLLFDSYTTNDALVGQTVDVWVDTEIAKDGVRTVGHTKQYTKVLLPMDDSLVGKRVTVRILSAAKFHVVGEVVDDDASSGTGSVGVEKTKKQNEDVKSEYVVPILQKQQGEEDKTASSSSAWMMFVLPYLVALLAAIVFLQLQ